MAAIVIDIDVSSYSIMRCRRLNQFSAKFVFKKNGVIQDISTDQFTLRVFDQSNVEVLTFSPGSGTTVIGNALYLSKTHLQMSLPAGEYVYDLKQTKVGDIVRTRLHGIFDVLDERSD